MLLRLLTISLIGLIGVKSAIISACPFDNITNIAFEEVQPAVNSEDFPILMAILNSVDWTVTSRVAAPNMDNINVLSDKVGQSQDETGKLGFTLSIKNDNIIYKFNDGDVETYNNCSVRVIEIKKTIDEIMAYESTKIKEFASYFEISMIADVRGVTSGFRNDNTFSVDSKTFKIKVPKSITAAFESDLKVRSFGLSDASFMCDSVEDSLFFTYSYTFPKAFIPLIPTVSNAEGDNLIVTEDGGKDCGDELCTVKYLVNLDVKCNCKNVEQVITYSTTHFQINVTDSIDAGIEFGGKFDKNTDYTYKCKVKDLGNIDLPTSVQLVEPPTNNQYEVDDELKVQIIVGNLDIADDFFEASLNKAEICGKCPNENYTICPTSSDHEYTLLYKVGSTTARDFVVLDSNASPGHIINAKYNVPGFRCESALMGFDMTIDYTGAKALSVRRRLLLSTTGENSRKVRATAKASKIVGVSANNQNNISGAGNNKITIISTIIFGLLITLISV